MFPNKGIENTFQLILISVKVNTGYCYNVGN